MLNVELFCLHTVGSRTSLQRGETHFIFKASHTENVICRITGSKTIRFFLVFGTLLFCPATASLFSYSLQYTLVFLDEKKRFHISHTRKMNFALQSVNEDYQNFYSHADSNNIIAEEQQRNAVFTLIYHFCMP